MLPAVLCGAVGNSLELHCVHEVLGATRGAFRAMRSARPRIRIGTLR